MLRVLTVCWCTPVLRVHYRWQAFELIIGMAFYVEKYKANLNAMITFLISTIWSDLSLVHVFRVDANNGPSRSS